MGESAPDEFGYSLFSHILFVIGFVGAALWGIGLAMAEFRWLAPIGLLVMVMCIIVLDRHLTHEPPALTTEETYRELWTTKQGVMCFLFQSDRTLLTRDWKPTWKPPTGALFPDETVEDGVVRVVLEETGATILGPVRLGIIRAFDPADGSEPYRTIHVFRCDELIGSIPKDREYTVRGKGPKVLRWFAVGDLPNSLLIFDKEEELLPNVLSRRHFVAEFHYESKEEPGERELREYKIEIVNDLSEEEMRPH